MAVSLKKYGKKTRGQSIWSNTKQIIQQELENRLNAQPENENVMETSNF